MVLELNEVTEQFFLDEDIDFSNISNEASLQLEIAIYLRKILQDSKVSLEIPVNTLVEKDPKNLQKKDYCKKEIDIVVEHKGVQTVLELKFVRKSAGFPMPIYHAIEDVKFCEQILQHTKTKHFITIFLTDHNCVIKSRKKNIKHIYKMFNDENPIIESFKPENKDTITHMKKLKPIELDNSYPFKWKNLPNKTDFKYYIITEKY